jgi:hypothetical protein
MPKVLASANLGVRRMAAWGDRIVNQSTEGLPGFWRFAWLFLMQPITLNRLSRGVGASPGESLWKLLRCRRSPADNWWLLRSAQLLIPSVAVAAAAAAVLSSSRAEFLFLAILVVCALAGTFIRLAAGLGLL